MPKPVKKTSKKRKTASWMLDDKQCRLLQELVDLFPGGESEFVRQVVIKENRQPVEPTADQSDSTKRQFNRVVHPDPDERRVLSSAKLRVYAEVLGLEYAELHSRLILPNRGLDSKATYVPWKTDEAILKEHRTVLHQYHLTKDSDGEFWIYNRLDFTTHKSGCLFTSFKYPYGDEIPTNAFGYLFHGLLLIIFETVDPEPEQQSFHLYYDFAERSKRHEDHWGVLHHANFRHDIGVTACLISKKPLLGITKPGRLDAKATKALEERWRTLDGHRCNRILELFGHDGYTDSLYKRPTKS